MNGKLKFRQFLNEIELDRLKLHFDEIDLFGFK